MPKNTTETKPEKQTEKKQPTVLTDEQLDGPQGVSGGVASIRMEGLNNKYPENMQRR